MQQNDSLADGQARWSVLLKDLWHLWRWRLRQAQRWRGRLLRCRDQTAMRPHGCATVLGGAIAAAGAAAVATARRRRRNVPR